MNYEENDEIEENDHVVDDVDMSVPQPVQDEPEQTSSEPETNDGDAVIGRRNDDLPTENLSTPPTN